MPDEKDISEAMIEGEDDPFWAIRGKAIQSYAGLEQALCGLFATLADVEHKIAGIIFFKITSASAVTAILEKLVKKRHGDTYTTFWNSVDKFLKTLASTRNNVVHWNIVHYLGDQGFQELKLHPANLWDYNENTPGIAVADLVDFIHRCAFCARLCNMFKIYIDPRFVGELDAETRQTWHDIFQQALVYPPPSSHPLFQKPPESETPPPPSRGSPQSDPPHAQA